MPFVVAPEFKDTSLPLYLDEDAEFDGTHLLNQGYQGMWYGNQYGMGTNSFLVGWSTGVKNNYVVYLALDCKEEYTYSSTALIPNGVYTFYDKQPAEPTNAICNIKSASRRAYIKNNFTGTVVYINEGTVEFTDDKLLFNISGPCGDKTIHFTGWMPNKCAGISNRSAERYAGYMAWAE